MAAIQPNFLKRIVFINSPQLGTPYLSRSETVEILSEAASDEGECEMCQIDCEVF